MGAFAVQSSDQSLEVLVARIRHMIVGRPALVGLLAIVALFIVAACNSGSGGGTGY